MEDEKHLETLLKQDVTEEQRTEEWYKKRYDLLTASDCASSLESNPFQTKHQLLQKKTKPFTMTDYTKNPIDAIEHGIMYEPIALNLYQRFQNTEVHQVGLYVHPKHQWLGASPDGITATGKLVEIKCVYRRYLYEKPPLYYWIQTQIQMEVTDLDECDLFQCKFIEYKSKADYKVDKKTSLKGHFMYKEKVHYWKLEQYKCTNIKRDKKWFIRSLPLMESFWADVLACRKTPLSETSLLETSLSKTVSKRKRTSSSYTQSPSSKTRPRSQSTDYVYTDWNEWVSATNTRNYAFQDPVLDFLSLYGKSHGIKTDDEIDLSLDSGKFLKKQGLDFETAVYENIVHRFSKTAKIVTIGSYEEAHSIYKANITFQAMKEGVPIIFQAVLHDNSTKTYGVVDILCRSDYLSKIFEHHPLDPSLVKRSAPKLKKIKTNTKYHYAVIDIKCSTLKLHKDTETIYNDPQMKANKMQLCIYNQALGTLQGYTPPVAYILGKRIIDDKETHYNPFYLAGRIDFEDKDKDIIEQTSKAVLWYRKVKTEGHKWKLYPPSTPELYPNMSNQFDYPWHSAKKELAHRTKEITVMWYCAPSQRTLAHSKGITSWDDPRCTAELLGFKNVRAKQLQSIITVNQSNISVTPTRSRMPEEAIKTLTIPKNQKHTNLEFFVDFETVSDTVSDFSNIRHYKPDKFTPITPRFTHLIYMIGFGYIDPKKHVWKHKSYMIEHLTSEDEATILKQFIRDMKHIKTKYGYEKNKYPKIYHWGHAELTIMLRALSRNPQFTTTMEKQSWFDLCEYFKSVPITIKGVFSFGLKDVVKGLYSANLIPTQWQDQAIDGKAAMYAVINADECCQKMTPPTPLTENEEMIQITQYNETDCKVMMEILEYLRQYYIADYKSLYFTKINFEPDE